MAKPPLLAWPPLEAISETSSLGRLAKLPGFVLSAMLKAEELKITDNLFDDSYSRIGLIVGVYMSKVR